MKIQKRTRHLPQHLPAFEKIFDFLRRNIKTGTNLFALMEKFSAVNRKIE